MVAIQFNQPIKIIVGYVKIKEDMRNKVRTENGEL